MTITIPPIVFLLVAAALVGAVVGVLVVMYWFVNDFGIWG